MAGNIIKLLRSIVAGSRPTGKTYGEPYANLTDNQFGVFDSSNVARDLIGVPFFNAGASYSAGQPVVQGGNLYTAIAAVVPGAFNSAQWTLVKNPVRYDAPQTLTTAQQLQARQNIYAAPFDAMAFNGMQINGSFDISQENGTANVGIVNASKYVCDNFYVACIVAAGGQLICRQLTGGPGLIGFPNTMSMIASPGMPTFAAADYTVGMFMIEGSRWARLGFGNAGALPVTLAFWVFSYGATGTATASIRNGPGTRSYLANFNIPTANVWQYVTVTIPGDTAGAWAVADTANAAYVGLCFGAGTNYQDVPNVWNANGRLATATTTNFFSTTNYGILLGGLGIFPGSQAPTATQHPLIMRPAQSELLLVQRYYQKFAWAAEGWAQPRVNWTTAMLPMRVSPTITRVTVGSITNIRNNDPANYVLAQAQGPSSMNISMESQTAGFVQCAGFVEALSARF